MFARHAISQRHALVSRLGRSRGTSLNPSIFRNTNPHIQRRLLFSDSQNPFHSAWRRLSILFRDPPRGFGRFKPRGTDYKPTKPEGKQPNFRGTGSGGGGGGGGGSGGGGSGGGSPFEAIFKDPVGLALMSGLGLISLVYLREMTGTDERQISFQEFRAKLLDKGLVERVEVVDQTFANVILKNAAAGGASYTVVIPSVDTFERQLEESQYYNNVDPRDYVPVHYQEKGMGWELARWGIFYAMLGGALLYGLTRGRANLEKGMKKGGTKGFNLKVIMPGDKNMQKTTFKDVAGMEQTKLEITEFIQFLNDASHFEALGAKVPKGALLSGPPGTGKTLLAKAAAGEANVPFISVAGSDFIELYVGVGPARVREMFEQARKLAPCIIFIDEIDALARQRTGSKGGSHEERDNTVNQLLVEMDGFESRDGVVILAGTNRENLLDDAILRPGRFDRKIPVPAPNKFEREEIFKVHLRPLKLAVDADKVAAKLAVLCPGFTGADISALCNEAAILAARQDKEAIELVDFEKSTDRVLAGLEREMKLTPFERRKLAIHEAGHATIGWFLEHAMPTLKVTIVPRGKALGFSQSMTTELQTRTKEELYHMVLTALAGRAAEEVFYGVVTTGAADDLSKVTKIARAAIINYGMSEKLPNLMWQGDVYCDATKKIIDDEIFEFVERAYKKTVELVEEKKELIEALATSLLENETVNHEELVSVLGARPHVPPDYAQYLEGLKERIVEAEVVSDEKKSEDQEGPTGKAAME